MKTAKDWIPVLNSNANSWTATIEAIRREALLAAAEIELGTNSKDHNPDCRCVIFEYRKAIVAVVPPAEGHHTKRQTPPPCPPAAPPRHD